VFPAGVRKVQYRIFLDIERVKARGAQIHTLSTEESARWQLKMQESLSGLLAEVGGRSQEFYNLIQSGKQAFKEQASGG